VRGLLEAIERHGRQALVGVHGGIFVTPFRGYYRSRHVHRAVDGLGADTRVHFLGTGTLAYHAGTIRLSLDDFPPLHMTDLQLAHVAEKQRIERIVIVRPLGWLGLLPTPPGTTIYERFRHSDEEQTSLVRRTSWKLPFLTRRQFYGALRRRPALPSSSG
jgi:hypothetical protein